MKVDFDNLRVFTAESYNRICRYLNQCIEDAKKQGEPDFAVPFDPDEMDEWMQDLRMQIGTICASYSDEFKDVSVGLELETFNPE